MKLLPLAIAGTYAIVSEPIYDARGSFARTFDAVFMRNYGLVDFFTVEAIAFTEQAGTVRGLHFQFEPHCETKIVRALAGSLYDVILDLRPDSATFGMAIGVELSAASGMAVYIPAGCAHGYQTCTDNTTALYAIAGDYRPDLAGGIRYDDPGCAINWPLPVTLVSAADRELPALDELVLPFALRPEDRNSALLMNS